MNLRRNAGREELTRPIRVRPPPRCRGRRFTSHGNNSARILFLVLIRHVAEEGNPLHSIIYTIGLVVVVLAVLSLLA